MISWTLLSRFSAMLSLESFLLLLLLGLGCYTLGTSVSLVLKERKQSKARELLPLRVSVEPDTETLYQGPNIAAKWWRQHGREWKHKRA